MKRIPTLEPGSGYHGPLYKGCYSIKPMIYHAKNGKWLVGPELYVKEVLARGGHNSNKRLHKYNTKTVRVFSSRASAVSYFNSLRSEIELWNENHKEG